jgi:hypothetical protein
MAKQTGPVKLEGTIGNICFYKMGDEWYARLKSSLTGKRVKKDPRFRRTMEFASFLSTASKIASEIYRTLPKQRGLYRKITGMAMQLLKKGIAKEVVLLQLKEVLSAPPLQTEQRPAKRQRRPWYIRHHNKKHDQRKNKPVLKPARRRHNFIRPLFSCIAYQNGYEHRKRMLQRKKSNARVSGDTFDIMI